MSNYNGWTSLPQSLAASFSGVSQPSRAARRRRFMDSCCRICAAANASMARLVSVRGSIRKPGEFVLLTFGSRTKEPRQCWRRGGNKDERVAHISTPSRMAELQGTCGSAVLCRCIRMTKGRRRGRKQERGRRPSRKADCRVSFISLFLRAGSVDQLINRSNNRFHPLHA